MLENESGQTWDKSSTYCSDLSTWYTANDLANTSFSIPTNKDDQQVSILLEQKYTCMALPQGDDKSLLLYHKRSEGIQGIWVFPASLHSTVSQRVGDKPSTQTVYSTPGNTIWPNIYQWLKSCQLRERLEQKALQQVQAVVPRALCLGLRDLADPVF